MPRHALVNGLGNAGAYVASGCGMDNLLPQVMGPLYSLVRLVSNIQALQIAQQQKAHLPALRAALEIGRLALLGRDKAGVWRRTLTSCLASVPEKDDLREWQLARQLLEAPDASILARRTASKGRTGSPQ